MCDRNTRSGREGKSDSFFSAFTGSLARSIRGSDFWVSAKVDSRCRDPFLPGMEISKSARIELPPINQSSFPVVTFRSLVPRDSTSRYSFASSDLDESYTSVCTRVRSRTKVFRAHVVRRRESVEEKKERRKAKRNGGDPDRASASSPFVPVITPTKYIPIV